MDFFDWFILIIVGAVSIAALQIVNTSRKKSEIEGKLALSDFSITQKFISADGSTGIGLDEEIGKLILVGHDASAKAPLSYSYRDILSVEIFVDGTAVTKTSRSSQLGGALLGGLALGGVGAIIGGLSGSTKTEDKAKRIDIRLIVNDRQNPIHDINFMEAESAPGGVLYNEAMNNARHWHGLITVLIREADAEDEASNTKTESSEPSSVATELEKLGGLRDKGILSEAEFLSEKQKLLDR